MENPKKWDLAQFLIQVTSKGKTVTYGEAAPVVTMEPHDWAFWHLLGAVSRESYEAHGVFLSAIVINKREGVPGAEFFALADECYAADKRTRTEDDLKFWIEEVGRVHQKFRVKGSKSA